MKIIKLPAEGKAIQFKGNDQECIAFCPVLIDPDTDYPSLKLNNKEIKVSDWIVQIEDNYLTYSDSSFKAQFIVQESDTKVKDVLLLGESIGNNDSYLIIQDDSN